MGPWSTYTGACRMLYKSYCRSYGEHGQNFPGVVDEQFKFLRKSWRELKQIARNRQRWYLSVLTHQAPHKGPNGEQLTPTLFGLWTPLFVGCGLRTLESSWSVGRFSFNIIRIDVVFFELLKGAYNTCKLFRTRSSEGGGEAVPGELSLLWYVTLSRLHRLLIVYISFRTYCRIILMMVQKSIFRI